jgi:hypothetical protein
MEQRIFETDWLASTPLFVDHEHGRVETSMARLTGEGGDGARHRAFNPEGLHDFLDFGYSVFGQTPLQGIGLLPHACRVTRTLAGDLEITDTRDPFDDYDGFRLSEADLVELVRSRVQDWEASLPADQEIVLPLSGGLDSRLLLWCLRDPSRVRAYTYGVCADQQHSMEVVHARALAEKFGLRWEHIPLGDYHRYFDDWEAEFGLSTHAHGMYHYEFYTQIRQRLHGRHAFLSGIVGDLWAGSIPPLRLDGAGQLAELGYTHGLRADPCCLRLSTAHDARERFWSAYAPRQHDHRFQVVTTVRLKIVLLSYLMRVPRLFGFDSWTPYLDIDIAMAMLNLPPQRRANRQWQRDFFARMGLDLENQGLRGSRVNDLNLLALRRRPLVPLDRALLAPVIDPDYVDRVNREVCLAWQGDVRRRAARIPVIRAVLRRIGLGAPAGTPPAYAAYLCLKPIENHLRRQDPSVANPGGVPGQARSR